MIAQTLFARQGLLEIAIVGEIEPSAAIAVIAAGQIARFIHRAIVGEGIVVIEVERRFLDLTGQHIDHRRLERRGIDGLGFPHFLGGGGWAVIALQQRILFQLGFDEGG